MHLVAPEHAVILFHRWAQMTVTPSNPTLINDDPKHSSKAIELTLYIAALLLLLISIALDSSPFWTPRLQSYVIIGSSILMVCGFSIWLVPWAVKHKESGYVLLLKFIVHGATILYSTLLARTMIVDALGLPPNDFSFTITALIVALYLPTLIVIAACFLALATTGHFLYAVLHDSIHNNLYMLRSYIGILFPPFAPASRAKNLINTTYFLRLAGAIYMSLFLSGALTTLIPSNPALISFTRWTAFILDYFPLSNYPGIPANIRVNLHENGIVSKAEFIDGEIRISTHQFSQQQNPNP